MNLLFFSMKPLMYWCHYKMDLHFSQRVYNKSKTLLSDSTLYAKPWSRNRFSIVQDTFVMNSWNSLSCIVVWKDNVNLLRFTSLISLSDICSIQLSGSFSTLVNEGKGLNWFIADFFWYWNSALISITYV